MVRAEVMGAGRVVVGGETRLRVGSALKVLKTTESCYRVKAEAEVCSGISVEQVENREIVGEGILSEGGAGWLSSPASVRTGPASGEWKQPYELG